MIFRLFTTHEGASCLGLIFLFDKYAKIIKLLQIIINFLYTLYIIL